MRRAARGRKKAKSADLPVHFAAIPIIFLRFPMIFRPLMRRACTAAALAAALCGTALAQVSLRVVPSSDLKVLDPVWTTAFITQGHAYMIYDTLFGMDEKGEIRPQMVGSYSASDDNKVWNFTLREGLRFHDGSAVTAQDVIASIHRWGARDALGQKMLAALERMEAEGDKSWRMVFKTPFGAVLDALGKPNNLPFIMPKAVAETPASQQIDNLVGSGPFTLAAADFRPGDRVIYRKNPDYVPRQEAASGMAGGKVVKVDQVEWIFLRDPQTQANALLNGEVDMLESVNAARADELEASGKVELVPILPPGNYAVHFNHKLPPFKDNPKLVRAAMLAINQEAVLRAQVTKREFYKPCPSVYICDSPYGASPTGFFTGKPQFDAAKKLLKEANYDGTPIVVMMPSDVPAINKLPVVYSELLKQAGFKVDLQQMDWASLLTRRAKWDPIGQGGWHAFITYWPGASASNPLTHIPLTGNGEQGFAGWPVSSEVEALKARFIETTDAALRKELAAKIQLRALEDGVLAPLGEVTGRVGVRAGVVSGMLPATAYVYWNIEKKQ